MSFSRCWPVSYLTCISNRQHVSSTSSTWKGLTTSCIDDSDDNDDDDNGGMKMLEYHIEWYGTNLVRISNNSYQFHVYKFSIYLSEAVTTLICQMESLLWFGVLGFGMVY